MLGELRELWKFRELLISMVQREIRVRYKNSVLGFFWSFINPLVTTLVMTVVFGKLLNNGIENYSAYVLASYLPFMFFQFAVLDSAQSVLASLPIVKKIYFPREILPLASIISNFIHLLLGMLVFFLFLVYVWLSHPAVSPFQVTTLYLPFFLIISLMLSTGLGLIVSALNTFYEDVKYVVGVIMYMLFFLSPVMYFVEEVANSIQNNPAKSFFIYKLYMLNPIAVLCVAYRKSLLAGVKVPLRSMPGKPALVADPMPMPWNYIAYAFLLSLGVLLFGYWLFNRMKWRFVERP